MGTYGAGGISMLFSDPLGNHELSTYILLTSRFSEIGGGVSYLNKTHRWNWGFLADQCRTSPATLRRAWPS